MDGEFAETDAPTALEADRQVRTMSELVRSFNWGDTPLGDAAFWPPSLKTTVRILLTSRFPMWMLWGPELTILYNDAYARTTLGKKHPWALGKPASVVWSEIWKDIGPRIERVLETGEASWDEMLPLILEAKRLPRGELSHVLVQPAGGTGWRECRHAVRGDGRHRPGARRTAAGLAGHSRGHPGGRQYQGGGFRSHRARPGGTRRISPLPCSTSSMKGLRSSQAGSSLRDRDGPSGRVRAVDRRLERLPVAVEALTSNQPVTVENLPELFSDLPTGSWDRPPARARLVPFTRKGQETPAGIFIAALNPYRQLEASYAGYLDLIAGQIAASITNAEAYEDEKTRAEALTELDRAKTSFFRNVSHELRTPLTLILGPIEDALTSQTPPTRAGLEMLHRNALRLLKMVNGLLDFVRIEAGRLHASYEPTDLSVFTAQLASVFRSAVERAGLELIVECPPLPEPVYVDREMWEKIVLNLLSNALKSTFDGEIRVSISN